MSEVKNTKNQAAQAEDILREPSGAQKDSGTGGKKEDCDRNIRYRGNVYQETLGQLSVPLKDDITVMWKDGKVREQEVPMPGFGKWRDPADFIIRHTYDIWDDKGMGKIYDHYKHNALVHTSDGVTYGRDQVIANSVMKLAGYPDIKDYIDDVIWASDGNGGFHTSMRWTWIGHNTGHTIYGPPTGRKVVVWGVANCYVKGDRVVEEWVVYNEISLIRQLGYDPMKVLEATANKGGSAKADTGTWGEIERQNGEFAPDRFGDNNGRYSDIEYFIRKSYHEIYNRRMFNQFKDNYAPDYRYHGPSDRELVGRGDFLQDQLNLFQAFPNLAMQVEDVYYLYDEKRDEYRCATRWNIIGTHEGFGIYGPATGAHVVISGISQHIIKDGMFREEWSIYDEFALMRKIAQKRMAMKDKTGGSGNDDGLKA